MRNKLICSTLSACLLGIHAGHGQTLSGDTFTDPLTSSSDVYWSSSVTSGNVISYSAAGTTLTDVATSSGAVDADLSLSLPTGVLPTINGDFTASLDFSGAVLNAVNDGALLDLYVTFASGDNFVLFYGPSSTPTGQNVLSDSWDSLTVTNTANAGTLSFARSGNTLTGAFDGSALSSTDITGEGALVEVDYELFASTTGGNSTNTATFSNFILSAPELSTTATPEPGTLALAALGGIAGALRLRRK